MIVAGSSGDGSSSMMSRVRVVAGVVVATKVEVKTRAVVVVVVEGGGGVCVRGREGGDMIAAVMGVTETTLDWTGLRACGACTKWPRVWTSLCRCHPAPGGVCRRRGDAVGGVWAGVVVTTAEARGCCPDVRPKCGASRVVVVTVHPGAGGARGDGEVTVGAGEVASVQADAGSPVVTTPHHIGGVVKVAGGAQSGVRL